MSQALIHQYLAQLEASTDHVGNRSALNRVLDQHQEK